MIVMLIGFTHVEWMAAEAASITKMEIGFFTTFLTTEKKR